MAISRKVVGTTIALLGAVGVAVYMAELRPTARKVAYASEANVAMGQIRQSFEKTGKMPATLEEAGVKPRSESMLDLGYPRETIKVGRDLSLTGDTVVALYHGISEQGPATVFYRFFTVPEGGVRWDCTGGTLEKKYRIQSCIK